MGKEAPWGLLSSQLPAALALTGTGVQKLSYLLLVFNVAGRPDTGD